MKKNKFLILLPSFLILISCTSFNTKSMMKRNFAKNRKTHPKDISENEIEYKPTSQDKVIFDSKKAFSKHEIQSSEPPSSPIPEETDNTKEKKESLINKQFTFDESFPTEDPAITPKLSHNRLPRKLKDIEEYEPENEEFQQYETFIEKRSCCTKLHEFLSSCVRQSATSSS